MISIKSNKEIEKMRRAGKLAAQVLDFIEPHVESGISTGQLDKLCHDFIVQNNAVPAPLNYHGFPKSICTSVNDVVCHGIPSFEHILQSGDIINIDVTVILDGYHGDTSRTFLVGEVSSQARELVKRTEQAMYEGIKAVKPKIFLYEVGRAIERYINQFGYGIVRDYGGHGIGRNFHEPPDVFHSYTPENKIKLARGMTFTVEPMINQGGSPDVVTSREDGWTVCTADGSLSAQFEHTIAVTKKGYEILTLGNSKIKNHLPAGR